MEYLESRLVKVYEALGLNFLAVGEHDVQLLPGTHNIALPVSKTTF